jgi:hypothetical protein
MYDAAYPPPAPPPWEVVAGYLGGDTPHSWSKAEWDSQPARYRLPIWVRSNPDGYDGAAEARTACTRAAAIGQPAGTTIGLDLETAIAPAYVSAFNSQAHALGYAVEEYGSSASIFKNPGTTAGIWDADWNAPGDPHLDANATATQYANGTQLDQPWDASLIDDSVSLWDMQEPISPPPDTPPWRAIHNIFTPIAEDGVFGPHTILATQYVIGVTTDGVWGPLSKMAFQRYLHVADDGVIGPVTVRALQVHVGAASDGIWGSLTTQALQRALNAGRF